MIRAALLAAATLAVLLSACAAEPPIGAEDQHAVTQLREIAARDADLDEPTGAVHCWVPSDNMVDTNQWRVLCRVHYDKSSAPRHRDMICIGDSTRDPVTDSCYQWAPYSDTPAFEDRPSH